jgi:hypothetical protein
MAEGQQQSAAAAAAERVRTIVEAAERSAAELEAEARRDAEAIRAEAERDAARAREIGGAVAERVDELKERLDEALDDMRASVAGLKAELDELRTTRQATAGRAPEAAVDEEVIAEAEVVAARSPDVAQAEGEEPTAVREPGAPEGARLLALKMALDGSPREETARYLRENFDLPDPEGLLDEVYAKAGR